MEKKALLTHVDALTNLRSVKYHLRKFCENKDMKVQIHLAGGDHSTRNQAVKIVEFTNEFSNTEIISANIGKGGTLKSLAIDSRTGEVFTSFNPTQLAHGENSNAGITNAGTP